MRKIAKSEESLDKFLVCGLGGLGQHCVVALKKFEVSVIAIDKIQPQDWEIPNLPNLWDDLVIGDCRQISILQQAKIQQCRAAIIVTSNEQVNAETALVVRKLNPQTRLVVRSSKQNLNELLSEHLGNFVAFEPTQLPASSFALAALGTETLGFFNIEGEWLRVVKRVLSPGDRWCYGRLLHELNTHTRKILYISSDGASLSESFNDTLNGLLLSEVAYGYGVVPILYIKEQEAPKLMPSEDIRLSVGDAPKGSHPRGDGAERPLRARMVVLATTNGLRRIEHGINNFMLKTWQVHVERALTAEAVFEGANAITRISGCSLTMARNFMNSLPGTLQSRLYKHQAQRLIRELSKSQVIARLVPMTAQQGTDSI